MQMRLPATLLSALVAALAVTASYSGTPVPCGQDDASLIQRFAPMIKSSKSEQYIPLSWQRFAQYSYLKNGGQKIGLTGNFIQLVTTSIKDKQGDTFTSDLDAWAGDSGLVFATPTGFDEYYANNNGVVHYGSTWPLAVAGEGVYAHVEGAAAADGHTLKNIEYIILWPYNKGPQILSKSLNHYGDITYLIVLYDPTSDKVIRVTFPAHGCILQALQTTYGQSTTLSLLAGADQNLNSNHQEAVQQDIDDANWGFKVDNLWDCIVLGSASASDKHLFWVPDPSTGLYEHPAVYEEQGTHESWPNQSGSLSAAGAHDGQFVSYIPTQITNLGSYANPTTCDTSKDPNDCSYNVLHYNGKIGSDPQTFVRHREWCWPGAACQWCPTEENCNTNIPQNFFASENPAPIADISPYQAISGTNVDGLTLAGSSNVLGWPQSVSEAKSDVYLVPTLEVQGQSATGAQGSPFGGIKMAYSFAPAGSTMHLQSGTYNASAMAFCKNMTLTATSGTVVINGSSRN
jgi:hypothetical protein